MCYHTFDFVWFADWQAQSTKLTYTQRLNILEPVIFSCGESSPFRLVKSKTCDNENEIREFYSECLDEGYEGVMLKDIKAPYRWKRSDAILKLKPVATEEGTIVDWYEAKESTKRAGQFGGFVILTPNGVTTRVGGGYCDDLKNKIFRDGPDTYIGKIAEVEHQPPFTPDGKLRFPVFCRFRDIADVDPKILAAAEAWTSAQ
jgi:ATP-dependent DNA ligase